MKAWRIIILGIICCLALAACGDKKEHAVHTKYKPTMDVKWKVEGSKLIVDVITDMHISPEHYGQGRKEGEGHIHMYLDDGEKIGVKAGHKEFEDLKPGRHVLKVSLHNNDHTPYDVTKTIEFEIR
ncbi:hypothetical protein GE107_18200 [Cohnella sp. CFH 77786]|uniref:hypothetical protein n=1 Tax=Cohnella sp. CFH 77786 TaxID=2662265 RepID=UPI001C60EDD8|nr:hypothetical protein [Cohnella sp. CFH 77786]MBW5447991.1 hypothetical protein [Cohnella sp. CFH 77786]